MCMSTYVMHFFAFTRDRAFCKFIRKCHVLSVSGQQNLSNKTSAFPKSNDQGVPLVMIFREQIPGNNIEEIDKISDCAARPHILCRSTSVVYENEKKRDREIEAKRCKRKIVGQGGQILLSQDYQLWSIYAICDM